MKMKTILAPVTILHEGTYVAPGTPVTLAEDEANALNARFGTWEEGGTLSLADINSVELLNSLHAIHS